jgi:hypothetical protein
MKYLKLVYDGSESKLVPGYWCVEVYAHLNNKRILPLIMYTFGIDEPQARRAFEFMISIFAALRLCSTCDRLFVKLPDYQAGIMTTKTERIAHRNIDLCLTGF